MKRFNAIAIVSAFVLCAASFASCSENNKNNDKNKDADNSSSSVVSTAPAVTEPPVTAAPVTELDDSQKLVTLDTIRFANSFDKVLNEKETSFECIKQYFNNENTLQKVIYTAVENKGEDYVYSFENNTGDKYFLDSQSGKYYSELYNSYGVPFGIKFMDDASLKEEYQKVDDEHLCFSEFEVITANEIQGDSLVVVTETPVTEDSKWDFLDFFEYINIEEDFAKIRTVYTLDSQTKRVNAKTVSGIKKKGADELKIGDFQFAYSDLKIETPEFIGSIESKTDVRTVKVTDASGAVNEYMVPKGVLFSFPVPEGYMMFSDPEGHIAFSYDDNMDKDVEVYILPF